MMRKPVLFILIVLLTLAARADDSQLASSMAGKPFFRNISAVEYHGHNRNFDIECDSIGNVYIANFEGLLVWNGIRWRTIHTPGISRITDVCHVPGGDVWFGGYNVLGCLAADGNVSYLLNDTAVVESVGEIKNLHMEDGLLAFSASDKSYIVREGEIVESGDALPDEDMLFMWDGVVVNQRLVIPEMGVMALATESNGIVLLDSYLNVIFTLTADDGLCSNSVTSISYDSRGSLWGVTDNGVFQICIAAPYSRYGASDGLVGQVTSILRVDSTLFVGTLQGLFRQNESAGFDKVQGIDLACWSLVLDSDGTLLAATAQGVFRCTPDVTQLTEKHTLCIMPVENGFISGELDGLYVYDSVYSWHLIDPVPNACKLEKNENGDILAINYARETYRYSTESGHFVPEEDSRMSLLFNYTDYKGRLWQCGNDGLGLRCDQLDSESAEWCMPFAEYSIESMYVEGEEAFIGGNFGLIRMDIQFMETYQAFKPTLMMRTFSFDGSNVSFGVATDKIDPIGSMKYSYRLQDAGAWSRWSDEQTMNFEHLSPGKYSLSVRCRDAYGNISQTVAVPFQILPPYYFRWYAFVLYFLVLGILSYAVLRYRLYKAKMEQERLERIVEQRTSQLKDAQNQLIRQEREATVGKLTKGLIDRILNPMNYINNFSHLTQGLARDLEQDIEDDKDKMTKDIFEDCLDVVDMMKTNLEKIEQHGLATTRILKAMEELLKDHSGKLETTDMEAMCRKDLEMLEQYSKEDIEAVGIEIRFNVAESGITALVNQVNMSKVIMSMLSNSVHAVRKKFSQQSVQGEKPLIQVELTRGDSGTGCVLSIRDNGIGIEDSIIDKIFDPFFTTKPTGEAPGVGLYLSQQIVQDADGHIEVESKKDEYAQFKIVLP